MAALRQRPRAGSPPFKPRFNRSARNGASPHRNRYRLNAVLAFWIAYILTRPLGASLGDYLSQPRVDGGLGLGTVVTSALFLATILGVVIYLTRTRKDTAVLVPSAGERDRQNGSL